MLIILLSIFLVLLLFYTFVVWNNNYWKKHNVPFIPPVFGFGNVYHPTMLTKSFNDVHDNIYKKFRNFKYCGYFSMRSPQLFLIDNELIKTVMIRDIQYFNDNAADWNDPYLGKNPFVLKGDRWRLVKSQISAAFSSGRIKHMFPQFVLSANRFVDFLKTDPEIKEKNCIYMKELCGKYTVDAVASATLNLDVKTFENPNSEFRQMGLKIFQSETWWGSFKMMLLFVYPKILDIFGLALVTEEIGGFFKKVIQDQIQYRKENNVVYNDFLDFLIELRSKCTEYDFDITHMAAHIIAFFTDGFETSAISMSHILFEIAANPEVQERLRQELDNIYDKNGGQLTYEGVQEMKYMDCVIQESLRLHPAFAFFRKRSMAPYKFPPCKDGAEPYEAPKGTVCVIPIASIMRDQEYFPEPDKFNPDRWADDSNEVVKGTYLSFGQGPRQCIGMRFATTQLKVGIASILRNFEIRVDPKTKTPLEIDPASVLLKPLGGIWLKIYERKDLK